LAAVYGIWARPIINEKKDPKIVIQTMTQKQKTKYYFIAGMWSLDVVPSKKWCRNGLRSEKKTTSWPQNMKVYELVGNENGKMLWKMGKLLPKKI